MQHIPVEKELHLTAFRKISIGNWRHPRDPQTYAEVELNIEPALAFLEEHKKEQSLSITHYITKILGDCFRRQPEMNSVLLRGKLYERKSVSAFITTLLKHKEGADLSGFQIKDIDSHSIHHIAEICDSEVMRLRKGDDLEFYALNKNMKSIPTWLLVPLFKCMDFFKYTLNRALKSPGLEEDRFGSVIITNIGALGLQSAFTPLTPIARTPFLASVGKPYDGVVAHNGQAIIQQRIKIGFTFDHRYIDGFHGSKMLRHFTKVFENPKKFTDLLLGADAKPST